MNNKLQKYIKNYTLLTNYKQDIVEPDGAMLLLINLGDDFEFIIKEEKYTLSTKQAVLINALEESLYLNCYTKVQIVRFQGAGASFYFENMMETFMFEHFKPIFLDDIILTDLKKKDYVKELDEYFKSNFKASALPFNIMNIIEYLDDKKVDYCVDEVLLIANVPRKILDKAFRLKAGVSIKTYAHLR